MSPNQKINSLSSSASSSHSLTGAEIARVVILTLMGNIHDWWNDFIENYWNLSYLWIITTHSLCISTCFMAMAILILWLLTDYFLMETARKDAKLLIKAWIRENNWNESHALIDVKLSQLLQKQGLLSSDWPADQKHRSYHQLIWWINSVQRGVQACDIRTRKKLTRGWGMWCIYDPFDWLIGLRIMGNIFHILYVFITKFHLKT